LLKIAFFSLVEEYISVNDYITKRIEQSLHNLGAKLFHFSIGHTTDIGICNTGTERIRELKEEY
jgi:hypothetical protein